MKFVQIVMFTLLLNFAIGLTIQMFPGVFDNPEDRSGLVYDSDYAADFQDNINGTINPSKDLEDEANIIDRILDKLALGVVLKFLKSIGNLLYGIVNLLEMIFSPFFSTNTALLYTMTYTLRLIISLAYIKGVIDLWTGKEVSD